MITAYPSHVSQSLDPDRILHLLIFDHTATSPTCLKVVWSLPAFVNSILSRLPDTVRTELSRPPHRARWGNYRLFYAPDKVFSVNKNGSEANFYDLGQYFPEEQEPETLGLVQEKADELQAVLTGLGNPNPKSLSSPVACFKGHQLLETVKDAVSTIFDAPSSQLDAYELALQCTPREWVSNFQIGTWE